MDKFSAPEFLDENIAKDIKQEDIPSSEQVAYSAQEVMLRGVIQGQLDPRVPLNQVLVAGAIFIATCASLGISAETAYERILSAAEAAVADAAPAYEPPGYL